MKKIMTKMMTKTKINKPKITYLDEELLSKMIDNDEYYNKEIINDIDYDITLSNKTFSSCIFKNITFDKITFQNVSPYIFLSTCALESCNITIFYSVLLVLIFIKRQYSAYNINS